MSFFSAIADPLLRRASGQRASRMLKEPGSFVPCLPVHVAFLWHDKILADQGLKCCTWS